MKKQLVCAILALALLSVTALAVNKEVPIKGSGSGMITAAAPNGNPNELAISTHGQGEATLLGRFTREESITLNTATGTATGTIIFTAADGSELHCTFAGGFTGANTIAGTYTFAGGTGRFANAAGSAYFTVVQSDMVNFTFEFAGTIDIN
jgi:hypothetical protein